MPPGTIVGATPSALNLSTVVLSNGSATNVTNITGGVEGQLISVVGDGQSTLVHGTNIFTNTGANKLLADNEVYQLIFIDGVWREIAAAQQQTLIERYKLYDERTVVAASSFLDFTIDGSYTLVDLREFSNVRLILNHRDTTAFCQFFLQYATTFGGSYTTIATAEFSAGVSTEVLVTATAALPAGAKIQNCYLRGAYNAVGNAGTHIVSLTAEFY